MSDYGRTLPAMDLRRELLPVKPLPVAPGDVPEHMTRVVWRTALRQGRVMDMEDAALMAAVVIAAVAPDGIGSPRRLQRDTHL